MVSDVRFNSVTPYDIPMTNTIWNLTTMAIGFKNPPADAVPLAGSRTPVTAIASITDATSAVNGPPRRFDCEIRGIKALEAPMSGRGGGVLGAITQIIVESKRCRDLK